MLVHRELELRHNPTGIFSFDDFVSSVLVWSFLFCRCFSFDEDDLIELIVCLTCVERFFGLSCSRADGCDVAYTVKLA